MRVAQAVEGHQTRHEVARRQQLQLGRKGVVGPQAVPQPPTRERLHRYEKEGGPRRGDALPAPPRLRPV